AETGINLADWCVVTGNTANFNGFGGISCLTSCTITGNQVHQNGGSPAGGSGRGIDSDRNSTPIGHTARNKGAGGLGSGSTSGYGNNVVNLNNGGNTFQQVFGGSQIDTNVCGADTTCP